MDNNGTNMPGGNPPEGLPTRQPRRVNLPGFISEDVGLGDVVKQVTSSVGFRPCGGCLRRAQTLNSWLVFSSGKSR